MSKHHQIQQSKKPESSPQRRSTLIIQTPVSNPAAIIQRSRINPKSLTPADVLHLQRTIGNRAVGRLLSEIRSPSTDQQVLIQRQKLEEEETCPSCVQRQEIPEEEETIQGKMIDTIQRQEVPEEEENPLQGVFESNPEQVACPSCIQRKESEEEEPLQPKRENNTGMPDNLKAGVESLSGIDMSDVRVHYNSDKPAEVGALAYTQGTNIHVAPGQERHLPHEAWHVVQQVQGRVKPTMQLKDVAVNDDVVLEKEADIAGNRALQLIINRKTELDKKVIESSIQTQFIPEKSFINNTTTLIQRQPGKFYEDRQLGHGGKIFYSTIPPRQGIQIYFRAMQEMEYNQLSQTGYFDIQESYQGITQSFDYAKGYFGANRSHHLVEFTVQDGIDLTGEFRYSGTGEKLEDGARSLGLGSRATHVRAGQNTLGGEYFMECLKARIIRWRLVGYIGERPPDVCRG
ncbi:DUF4157 domain-containing protein [Methanosarcina sp. WWM596]|uniref:eCIS core domain-containing protein n=1 Tax=Methanosarcina sp. WWM596 TaxID=1434103 RepID=UPI0006157E06|nr:DUF4157 domain-containing protein [Methanosarcina sp. WWM596]AKB18681.1 hypothetical protein MSWHS_1818 [Methanosarcina sp. WWM596]